MNFNEIFEYEINIYIVYSHSYATIPAAYSEKRRGCPFPVFIFVQRSKMLKKSVIDFP